MKNILVATDGSETSNKALIEARKLGDCQGSKVKIIHVRPRLLMPLHAATKEDIDLHKASVERGKKDSQLLLDDALKKFRDFPGEVSIVGRVGDAAEEIIKEAKGENHDLIIMGSCGTGAFTRVNVVLGSVCNKVLNLSNVNVLTVM